MNAKRQQASRSQLWKALIYIGLTLISLFKMRSVVPAQIQYTTVIRTLYTQNT